MINYVKNIGVERMSGVLTILTIASISLFLLANWDSPDWLRIVFAFFLYVVYLCCFLRTTDEEQGISEQLYVTLVVVQLFSVLGLFFITPYNFNAILLGIWSGHLVFLFSLRKAIVLSPVLFLSFYSVFTWHWHDSYVWLSMLLYWMLSLFTITMINAVHQEIQAKEASQQLNRELMAAQSLLKEATKQSERVRIARNIHDLVGHHLTALTINLQVASHKTQGEAKEQVDKSYAIAKLLLADVREAVTEIREKSNIELTEALHALADSVPRLQIRLALEENLDITNVELADTILRCVQESITNTLKHGHASEFEIELKRERDALNLSMKDNGSVSSALTLGNGLTGIKERVAAFKGQVQFIGNQSGFHTFITLLEPA
ncbi:MAG: hypothetical protein GJ680_04825 [Alteromonadaceae bacterium]|nr:hypothetical protein [Alteromonadaceae bacterium]